MIFVLTGPVHSGKTTLLLKLVREWKDQGLKVHGYLSLMAIKNGKTVGYDLFDIKEERAVPFLRRKGEKHWQKIGPFFFIPETLERAQNKILSRQGDEILVVDEIGPLELQGMGVWPALSMALSRRPFRCLLVVRRPLVNDFQKLLGERPVMIFDVEQEDVSGAILKQMRK